ncbi:hypothetical protein LBMAG53_23690 [Planctomycetota bacterium]|nr:hypothetical protein LBMAG53_23690 [Planctomycetota bacterium]
MLKKIKDLNVADPDYAKKYESIINDARQDMVDFQVLCREELQTGKRLVASSAPSAISTTQIEDAWKKLFQTKGHL